MEAGHDPGNMKDMPGQAGQDHVRLVAAGHGSQPIGLFDAGLNQDLAIQPAAHDGDSAQRRVHLVQGLLILVDQNHGVSAAA